MNAEAAELRKVVSNLEREKEEAIAEKEVRPYSVYVSWRQRQTVIQQLLAFLSVLSFFYTNPLTPASKLHSLWVFQAKVAEWQALSASTEDIRAEAARLEAQNLKLGDELDRLAPTASPSKGKKAAAAAAAELAAAVKA